jgi:hypothetical protein
VPTVVRRLRENQSVVSPHAITTVYRVEHSRRASSAAGASGVKIALKTVPYASTSLTETPSALSWRAHSRRLNGRPVIEADRLRSETSTVTRYHVTRADCRLRMALTVVNLSMAGLGTLDAVRQKGHQRRHPGLV